MEEKTYIVVRRGGFRSFITGALIGAGLALLFAPQSGRQTRDLLNEKSTEIKGRATDLAKDASERANVAYSKARGKIEDTLQSVKDRGQAGEIDQLKRDLEITEEMNNRAFPL